MAGVGTADPLLTLLSPSPSYVKFEMYSASPKVTRL